MRMGSWNLLRASAPLTSIIYFETTFDKFALPGVLDEFFFCTLPSVRVFFFFLAKLDGGVGKVFFEVKKPCQLFSEKSHEVQVKLTLPRVGCKKTRVKLLVR